MNKVLIIVTSLMLLTACDSSSSQKNSNNNEYPSIKRSSEPEFMEQEIVRFCTTCGGKGQIMTGFGPSNCPGCTAYGRPPQYKETILVPNPNYNRGNSNPSFEESYNSKYGGNPCKFDYGTAENCGERGDCYGGFSSSNRDPSICSHCKHSYRYHN